MKKGNKYTIHTIQSFQDILLIRRMSFYKKHFMMNFPLLFIISAKKGEDRVHEVDNAGQYGHGTHPIRSVFALRIKSH